MQALATEAIQGLSGGLVWLGLLHSLWLGLVTSALVALIFQTRRALSHRARHATLFVALCAVAFSPFVLTTAQYITGGRRSEGISAIAAIDAVILPGQAKVQPGDESSVPCVPISGGVSGTVPLVRFLGFMLDRLVIVSRVIRPYALAAWVLVVLGLSVVMALGVKGLHRLHRESSPMPRAVRERVQKLGRLLRLRIIPAIRVHATLEEPCLCGLFRPVILLPERWLATATADSLEAVLAHELAHARRADHLVNLAQRILEGILFFHPGVHWLSRSLRREREHCADALAVRLTGDPLGLAKALESVARFRVGPPSQCLVGTALGGENSTLLPRIQELIGMTPIRPRAQIWPFAAMPSAVVVALVAASIGFADEGPSPSRTPDSPSLKATQDTRSTETTPPAPVPAPAILEAESDRQISYQVSIFTLEPDAWRQHLKGQVKAIEQQPDMIGWVIEQPALSSLVKHFQGEANSNQIMAPKVTTFENAPALINFGPNLFRISSGETRRTARDRAGDTEKEDGAGVKVAGSHIPQGTRIGVEVSEPKLIPGQAGPASHPESVKLPSKPPGSTVVHSKGMCDVPEGSSLVVSLGIHERGVGPRSGICERLVVITPRRVVLESEEKPVIVKPVPPIRRSPGR